MMMDKVFRGATGAVALAVGTLLASATHGADAQALPAGANTSNPNAPFYIDLGGLDFSTSPPTRNPTNPKYAKATELPDGSLPPKWANGNFIIGPTHKVAPEAVVQNVPKGKIYTFTMTSEESRIYNPGYVRDETVLDGAVNTASTMPGDPSNVLVPTSYPGTWTRTISVYVPAQLRGRQRAPLLVVGDGGLFDTTIFTVLDNLIHEQKLPPMVAVTIESGGQDAQGSQRGFEYDAVNGIYAEFVEREVLPLVERKAGVRITHDPDARATMGISSSGAAAFTMAWFHPEWYHRVLAYSPTMVNQQWPHSTALRGGAWEYHSPWPGPANPLLNSNGFNVATPSTLKVGSPLIPTSDPKPIRFWYEVGDHDLWYPNPLDDGMHDWVQANESMAKVLAAKNYQYQFIFSRNAGHVDSATLSQTLGHALQWVWQGYQRRDRDDE
jgi:hypothetical protein